MTKPKCRIIEEGVARSGSPIYIYEDGARILFSENGGVYFSSPDYGASEIPDRESVEQYMNRRDKNDSKRAN